MKKILIVGKKGFLGEYKEMLSQSHFNVTHAFDEKKIMANIAKVHLIVFDDTFHAKKRHLRQKIVKRLQRSRKKLIVVSPSKKHSTILNVEAFGAADYIVKPFNYREFVTRLNAVMDKKMRICCVGGGTGLFSLLMGLKFIPDIHLTSIVSMSDDGGSSGKLRSSFGILPPGDIRRSLVALSNAPAFMNEVMQYRFKKGEGLSGHSFGNLFLTAIADLKGSMSESIRILGDILNIQGVVLPITNIMTTLCAFFEDGRIVKGEHKIDFAEERAPDLHIQKIWHEPETKIDADAYSALINSDIIIIGPGDLFTSIITNFVVRGFTEAVIQSKAKKVYICNLMTKPGETTGFDVFGHLKEIVKYMGGDYLDYVIVSNTKLPKKIVAEYKKKDQAPVSIGDITDFPPLTKAKLVMADVGDTKELVRHDSSKIQHEVSKIIKKVRSQKGTQ